MKKLNSSLVLVAALTALSGQAAAELRVVVTPTRVEQAENKVPAYVYVITKSDIEAAGALSVEDALRSNAAVQVTETSFGSNVSLRGFSTESAGSNVLILVDGQKLNNSDLSSPDLGSVAIGTVEKIEIINGSAGVVYGDQAVGGVINIITTANFEKEAGEISGSVSVSSGSYSSGRYSGDLNYQLTESLSVKLAAEKLDTNNFRANNNQQKDTGLTRLSYSNGKVKAYLGFSRTKEFLNSAGALSDQDVETNRRSARPEFSGDFLDSVTTQTAAGVSVALNDQWRYGVDVSDRETNQEASRGFFGFTGFKSTSKIERSQRELKPKLIGKVDSPFGEIDVVAGIDLFGSEYDNTSLNRNVEQAMTGIYSQVAVPVTELLGVSAGVRSVRVKEDVVDANVYPNGQEIKDSLEVGSLAVNFSISDNTSAYVKVEENFRVAKADEQAYTSPGVIGLKPQQGLSTELGLKHKSENWSVNSNVYQLEIEDEIIFDSSLPRPIGGAFAGANTNAEESERLGFLISGDYQILDSLKVGAQYSRISAKFTKGANEDRQIPGVAENTYGVFVEHVYGKLLSKLDVQYTGSRYASSDSNNSSAKVDSHHVTNLSTIYREKQWEAGIQVRNLFNEKYNAFDVEDAFAFPTPAIRRYPAAERNIWVTARLKF